MSDRPALVVALLALSSSACGSSHAATDSGAADAGAEDAGGPDAGSPDAGSPDAGPPDAGAPDAGPADAAPPPDGAALYADMCALCHGDSGEGYAADDAPALGNPDFLSIATDAFLRRAIEDGRPGTPMSAFGRAWGGPLDDAQIEALTAFVRSWQTEPAVDVHGREVLGTPGNAAPVFAERCATCHGDAGEGRTAVSLNNPVFLASASDGYLERSIRVGRRDTPMVPFADVVDDAAIGDLVALVRIWASEVPGPPPDVEPPTYDEIILNEDGPAPMFSELIDGRYVPADEVHAAMEAGARMVLLDARATSDFIAGHIPGALSVPFYGTDEVVGFLPRDGTWIVSYCACPHAASGRVMDALRERGFPRTAVLDEGVVVWADRGYPMTGPE